MNWLAWGYTASLGANPRSYPQIFPLQNPNSWPWLEVQQIAWSYLWSRHLRLYNCRHFWSSTTRVKIGLVHTWTDVWLLEGSKRPTLNLKGWWDSVQDNNQQGVLRVLSLFNTRILHSSLFCCAVCPGWECVQPKHRSSPCVDGQSDTEDSNDVHYYSRFNLWGKKIQANNNNQTPAQQVQTSNTQTPAQQTAARPACTYPRKTVK